MADADKLPDEAQNDTNVVNRPKVTTKSVANREPDALIGNVRF